MLVLAWGIGAWSGNPEVNGIAVNGLPDNGPVLVDTGPAVIRDVAIMVGIVYPILFVLSSIASRYSYRMAVRAGSAEGAARRLWKWQIAIFLLLAISDFGGLTALVVLAFVLMHITLNLWRPILISRFDEHSTPEEGATILSIESQSQRIATLIVAPLLGLVIDWTTNGDGNGAFWPIGLIGAAAAMVMWMTARVPKPGDDPAILADGNSR